MRLWRPFGVYPVAAHRRNQNLGQRLEALIVKIGDTLLLEGNPADIQRLAVEIVLVDVFHPSERAFRRSHAPIAISTLVGIVVCAAFGVAPLFC